MRAGDIGLGALLALGAVAAARQLQDTRAVRRRTLPPLEPGTWLLPPPGQRGLARRLATWQPARPRTAGGRAAAAAWAAPLTVLGGLLAGLGRAHADWDDELGCWVAREVGGPSGRLLAVMGLTANALGHVVVARTATPSRRLLQHEAVHVRQAERLGPLLVPLYLWCNARHGYRQNPLERAARAGVPG